ncbi:coiled-coil domain-containing protein 15 [Sciurus carolinensis]|uniref:coiled-coil domain-containing protein 15 n=1 Tax=Sciurus carolinensis TaxID=30640 RepID=UPI001FB2BAD5|nr:coiled-coil domain-containing protein 15 [Sciurus carolinensis]
MPGRMAPLKKSQNTTKLPQALNPMKNKDMLAVLAERNQAVVPVGVWVEPASPSSSEIPAYTSAHMIEEELKEQLRKKQEALKHFQRQVKYRVNQQIRLKKQQQLQKSFEAAEKEGSIAMQSSDPAHFTPKGTSIFPSNLNAAIGSSRFPPSQIFGGAVKDGENENELFQQQAQALSQTMKLARHRLASHKTVSKEKPSVFPDGWRKSFPTQQESDSEEVLSVTTDEKGRGDLFWGDKQSLFFEDSDKPFSRIQKVKFKNPLFVVIEEKEQKQSHFQGLEAQDYPLETKGDLPETQDDLIEVQSVEPETQSVEPDVQAVDLEVQAVEPEGQAIEPEVQSIKTETWSIMIKANSTGLEDGNIELKAQDFPPENQVFLPKYQDQDSLPRDPCVLPKDQNILPKYQDQNFLHKDQDFLSGDQNILPICQDQDFLHDDQDFVCRDQCVLPKDQNILLKRQDQNFLPNDQCVLLKDENLLHKCQEQDFPLKDQEKYIWQQPLLALRVERWKKEWPTSTEPYLSHRFQGQHSTGDQLEQKEEEDQQEKTNLKQPATLLIGRQGREELPMDVIHQDLGSHQQASIRVKKVHFQEPFSDTTDEEGREDFSLAGYQCLPSQTQFQDFIREQDRRESKRGIAFAVSLVCSPKTQDQTSPGEQVEPHTEEGLSLSKRRPVKIKKLIRQPASLEKMETGSLHFRQQPSVETAERWQEDLLLNRHQHHLPRYQRDTCVRRQVYNEHQSGLSNEFQTPLAFQSGVDQEEDKKERQKQYLRHRRLFMDIEREQVKEQKRQKEQKKKIEKIKKKKEQQRYAEEQKILKMNFNEEPHSGEKMPGMLAQLQLEEQKEAREKLQQQREKNFYRYVEALRAQVQEKMQLYNITLPPLCCCGPDFWDAHPDTCANNCIFYKNHRAYHRALHSVISSSDISEGNATLRNAIHNFVSAHKRTLKNL